MEWEQQLTEAALDLRGKVAPSVARSMGLPERSELLAKLDNIDSKLARLKKTEDDDESLVKPR